LQDGCGDDALWMGGSLDEHSDEMKVERVYTIVAEEELKDLESEMTPEQAKDYGFIDEILDQSARAGL